MPIYDIYKHPTGDTETTYGSDEAVKQGFSWWGLIFGGFWTAMIGMWPLTFFMFFLYWGMDYITAVFYEEASAKNVLFGTAYILFKSSAILLTHVLIGLKGDSWRRENYIKKNYQHLGTIEAANSKEALNEIRT